MRIVYLTASISRQAGGLFYSVRRLAQSVAAGGAEVHVLSGTDSASAEDVGVWAPLRPQMLTVKWPASLGYAPGLPRALAATAPDLAHTQGLWLYPSRVCRAWARQTGQPYVVSPRGMLDPWALRNSRWKKRLAAWQYENAHLRGAACLHALCPAEAAAFRRYGLRNPICVIPNGIDVPPESVAGEPHGCQVAASGKKVLLYLGRLHPKKGLRPLLQAWAETGAAAPEWALVIAGWDQAGHETELKRLARDLKLRDIHFVGPQFEAAKDAAYRRAQAFILPSFSEGLPMVVLEAWAYGRPVLMTPACNLPEGFDANAAIPIAPDPASIRQGLLTLCRMTEGQQREMGARGRQLVQAKFTWPAVACQMKAVYDWALGGGPAPAVVQRR